MARCVFEGVFVCRWVYRLQSMSATEYVVLQKLSSIEKRGHRGVLAVKRKGENSVQIARAD